MWPFRKPVPPPTLTNHGFARWLRAERPPFQWFLGLSELEQEQLAQLGDRHVEERALALGYAVRDPEMAEAAVAAAAGDVSGEEAMAKRLAATMIERLTRGQAPKAAAPARPAPPSTAGFGKRREARGEPSTAIPVPVFGVKPQEAT